MLIECGGRDSDEVDEEDEELNSLGDTGNTQQPHAVKLALLEILLANGIASLFARADGGGDEGSLDELHCYVEAATEQREECDVPDGVEDMVRAIQAAAEESGSVNFNGDGGFWEITITTATRECEITCGWYYTTSDSTSETETL